MPPLRVMSFNIRGAFFNDGANRWPERAALNVEVIARHAPDLIGFQELQQANLDVYQQHLPQYQALLGPGYNDQQPFQYPAILWNPQRLQLHDSGGFWLSTTPERHSRAWDTACIRSATWAQLEWLEHGLRFIHLNTHLDHISEWARAEGARLVVERLEPLRAEGLPVIVSGDFNCTPGSVAHRAFLEAGFVDSYTAAGHTDVAYTFHGFQGRAFVPRTADFDRIDWLLLRAGSWGFAVQQFAVLEDAAPPIYPSDHYPIIADLELR